MKTIPTWHVPVQFLQLDRILSQAADRFGTPLYVYHLDLVQEQWQLLSDSLPTGTLIHFSVKANPNPWIIRTMCHLGASLEIASRGELAAALQAGATPSQIIYVGPGKSPRDLEQAVAASIGTIVVESPQQLEMVDALSQRANHRVRVALRISPGRGQQAAVAMSGVTQFGFELDLALEMLLRNDWSDRLDIVGLHAYLGTGILDCDGVVENTRMILGAAHSLQQRSGVPLCFIDVGGGFGIPYYENDEAPYWPAIREPLEAMFSAYRAEHPSLNVFAVESGRFLVGPSGVFLVRVLDVKKSREKTFVVLDGGTNVFALGDRYRGFRPIPIRLLRGGGTDMHIVTLCGPLCTSMDLLAMDILMPLPAIGDVLAFYQAGAYGLTASPGLFLGHGFPAEVLYQGGQLTKIRERMQPQDLLVGFPPFAGPTLGEQDGVT